MSAKADQVKKIITILNSTKLKQFINNESSLHSLRAASDRLIYSIIESDQSEEPLEVDFSNIIYGGASSATDQADTEDESMVKALTVGMFTKQRLGVINDVIDSMVESYGLTAIFKSLITEIKLSDIK